MLPPRPLADTERKIVCGLLALGATKTMAAQYAGCRWIDVRAAAQADRAFALQLRRSGYQPEIKILRTLLDTACDPKQWRAACWILERLYSSRYGTRAAKAIKTRELQGFFKSVTVALQTHVPEGPARDAILEKLCAGREPEKSKPSAGEIDPTS